MDSKLSSGWTIRREASMNEQNELMAATVDAILFTVGRTPMSMREKVEALERAAQTLRRCAEGAEVAELELLWVQS